MPLPVWVSTEKSLFAPLQDQTFHLEGKLTKTDKGFEIEATRFYSVPVPDALAPALIFLTTFLL